MKTLQLNNLAKQTGASKLGLLVTFLLIVFFLTIGLKVAPLYVDHNLVSGILEELIDTNEADNMSTSEVRNRVSATLRINNIRDFDLSSITMRKESDSAIITLAYERRVELFANLDAVAKFDNEFQ